MNSHRKARKKAAGGEIFVAPLVRLSPSVLSVPSLLEGPAEKDKGVGRRGINAGSPSCKPRRNFLPPPFKCQAGHLHTSASLLSKTNRRSPLSAWAGLPRCSLWTRRTNAHSDQSRSSCSIHLDIHMYSYLHQINNNA